MQVMCDDIVSCMAHAEAAPKLVQFALEAAARMAADSDLQMMLLRSGSLWHSVPLLLRYDVSLQATLDAEAEARDQAEREAAEAAAAAHAEDPVAAAEAAALAEDEERAKTAKEALETDDAKNAQKDANRCAALACRYLSRAGSYLVAGGLETPECNCVRVVLDALFTPALSQMLVQRDHKDMLTKLNGTYETPTLIWNGAMRKELAVFMQKQRRRHSERSKSFVELMRLAGRFEFDHLAGEVIVGGVQRHGLWHRLLRTRKLAEAEEKEGEGAAKDLAAALQEEDEHDFESAGAAVYVRVFNDQLETVAIDDPGLLVRNLVRYMASEPASLHFSARKRREEQRRVASGVGAKAAAAAVFSRAEDLVGEKRDEKAEALAADMDARAVEDFVRKECVARATDIRGSGRGVGVNSAGAEASRERLCLCLEALNSLLLAHSQEGILDLVSAHPVDGDLGLRLLFSLLEEDAGDGEKEPFEFSLGSSAAEVRRHALVVLKAVATNKGNARSIAKLGYVSGLCHLIRGQHVPSKDALTAAGLKHAGGTAAPSPSRSGKAKKPKLSKPMKRALNEWASTSEDALSLSLEIVSVLCSTSECVHAFAVAAGGVCDLLSMLAIKERTRGEKPERRSSVAVLGKLVTDALHGQQVKTTLSRFLPIAMLDRVLRGAVSSPADAVAAFDTDYEEPDLIWSAQCRTELRDSCCGLLLARFHDPDKPSVRSAPDTKSQAWRVDDGEGARVRYAEHDCELQCGGVFIRLYLKDPRFNLKSPRSFLESLWAQLSAMSDSLLKQLDSGTEAQKRAIAMYDSLVLTEEDSEEAAGKLKLADRGQVRGGG